jgi:hypothetical protein
VYFFELFLILKKFFGVKMGIPLKIFVKDSLAHPLAINALFFLCFLIFSFFLLLFWTYVTNSFSRR